MGLAIVELFMAVEDEFGITFTDDEANAIATAGALAAEIRRKLADINQSTCLSSRTFYRLRREMVDLLDTPRRSIRPSTPLDKLLPRQRRHGLWQTLAKRVGLHLPPLQRPAWVNAVIYGPVLLLVMIGILLTVALFTMAGGITGLPPVAFLYGPPIVITGLIYWWVSTWITRPFTIALPRNCSSMRELINTVIQLNYAKNPAAVQPLDDREIWERLQALIARELNAPLSKITPSARFYEDLRAE